MPIVVVPGPNLGSDIVGPGLSARYTSDFVGPLLSGAHFIVNFYADTDATELYTSYTIPTQDKTVQLTPLIPNDGASIFTQFNLAHQQPMAAKVFLHDGQSLVDQSTIPLHWDAQSGVPFLLRFPVQGGGQGGLTPQQDQALTEVHESTFPTHVIDALTLTDLTPNGPSPGPVNQQLLTPIFAVIVRIATVPVELTPSTPDGDYWVPTLAVVRIFRGADLWIRAPIHTSSKIVSLQSDWLQVGVTAVWGSTWPLQLSLQTTMLEGVTAQVFLMNVP